jgi:GH24 family phage-related lysozyme (muramidase)
MMQMSAAARQQLTEASEGLRLTAYRDCVGVWTIGYGHTSRAGSPAVAPGMVITQQQADSILSVDLRTFEAGVSDMLSGVRFLVRRCEFDALVDLAFNIGLPHFRSSSLLAAYRNGDSATAARKFLDWNKAGGRPVAGLTQRRLRDQAWFLDGRLGARTTTQFVDEPMGEQAHSLDHADGWMARAINRVFP